MAVAPPAALLEWLDARPAEAFPKGATIVAPDAAPAHVWFVRTGLVRVFTLDAGGAEFNHDFVGDRGWVFGRVALRDGQLCCSERALGAVALQPTRAVRVALAELRQDPEIAAYFVEGLMQLAASRYGREADLVQRSAEERYRDLVAKQPGLLKAVPLREIAGWLGITPIALSRIRRRIRSE